MSKVARIVSLLIAGLLLAVSASADNVPLGRSITKLQVYDEFGVVRFSPAYDNNLGCSTNNRSQSAAIVWLDTAGGRVMWATLLAAQATEAKIGLGIDVCYSDWGNGVPVVHRVDVR